LSTVRSVVAIKKAAAFLMCPSPREGHIHQ
jgi:hypothetical protein